MSLLLDKPTEQTIKPTTLLDISYVRKCYLVLELYPMNTGCDIRMALHRNVRERNLSILKIINK